MMDRYILDGFEVKSGLKAMYHDDNGALTCFTVRIDRARIKAGRVNGLIDKINNHKMISFEFVCDTHTISFDAFIDYLEKKTSKKSSIELSSSGVIVFNELEVK